MKGIFNHVGPNGIQINIAILDFRVKSQFLSMVLPFDFLSFHVPPES